MKPTPTPDLLPCPFCGGKPEGSYTIKAVISCTECPASVAVKVHPGVFTTYVAQRDHEQRQAIEAWNRRAALSVPAAAVVGEPEGWKLVPIEPTPEMLVDIAKACRDFLSEDGPYPRAKAVYRATISSAPKPNGANNDA